MLLVLFIGIIIMVNVFYRSAQKNREVKNYVTPNLGIQTYNEELERNLVKLIEHLEAALDPDYIQAVKERVMREHKINEADWENRWFEWKRFCVMTTIYRNVQMYSREVGEIWHEMLMFTREYEDFSRKFLGSTLHHAPNVQSEGLDPEERAWFDLIYLSLFKATEYSHETWGAFVQHPLACTVIKDFSSLSKEELMEKYFQKELFSQIAPLKNVVSLLISSIQTQLTQLEDYEKTPNATPTSYAIDLITPWAKENPSHGIWILHLFLSVYYSEKFNEMRKTLHQTIEDQLLQEEKRRKKKTALNANKKPLNG